ncbi:MAG TPA: glycosyltransferase family 4 protein, partial [Christiangramia sp.]|nr:glycosyltransferase family 4 protein [Christiangramia sp.]
LMLASHILIVSSIEEGIPNVLVEAMAYGIPVISTDCGGVSELIEHKKEGWLVPSRQPNALADEIAIFRQLPDEEVGKVRENARRKVEEQHSYEKMLEGMENLYQKTMAKSEI